MRIRVYRLDKYWVVENPWAKRVCYNADFAQAMDWVDIELLERLMDVSHRAEMR